MLLIGCHGSRSRYGRGHMLPTSLLAVLTRRILMMLNMLLLLLLLVKLLLLVLVLLWKRLHELLW